MNFLQFMASHVSKCIQIEISACRTHGKPCECACKWRIMYKCMGDVFVEEGKNIKGKEKEKGKKENKRKEREGEERER